MTVNRPVDSTGETPASTPAGTPARPPASTDVSTALVIHALAGGPRVLHIAAGHSAVPILLAQEHDREVEVLRWPSSSDPGERNESPWSLSVEDTVEWADAAAATPEGIDDWVQPFLMAPVDVVVIEDVLDALPDADSFIRALASGAVAPGGLVIVAGSRNLGPTLAAHGFIPETLTDTGGAGALDHAPTAPPGLTVARYPSFSASAPPPTAEGLVVTKAENDRLTRELERTREQLARERATLAREMQLGKDELLAMDRQVTELQDRLQRLRHKNVLLRARVAQVSRERELVQERVSSLQDELFLTRDSRAVRAVTSVVEKARRRREGP